MEKTKIVFFLPNIFTALNMACGFTSIMLACKGEVFNSTLILILGAVFDLVDGKIARMMEAQSSFGEQFDSLSDMISFGVAPALIIHSYSLASLERLGIVVSFAYMLCAALRLARFNTNVDKINPNYFQGIPAPIAAVAIAGYIFIGEIIVDLQLYPMVALAYSLIYSILMISNVPFCSFKKSDWVKEHKKASLVIIILTIGMTFTYYKFMVASIVAMYVLVSVIYYIKRREMFDEVFAWKGDN